MPNSSCCDSGTVTVRLSTRTYTIRILLMYSHTGPRNYSIFERGPSWTSHAHMTVSASAPAPRSATTRSAPRSGTSTGGTRNKPGGRSSVSRFPRFGNHARVDAADFDCLGIRPYETTEVVGNLITNAGWTRLMNLLTNQGATQALDATHCADRRRQQRTPPRRTRTPTSARRPARRTAGSSWSPAPGRSARAPSRGRRRSPRPTAISPGTSSGIDQGTASGNTVTAILFNHKAGIAQGTKAAGQTWTATATITFS
jgi:hypothetical protein